jgi:putative redox protein
MTVRRFAERRKWPLTRIEARLTAESAAGKFERIDVELVLEGELTAEQRARLFELAEHCTISKTLKAGVPITMR